MNERNAGRSRVCIVGAGPGGLAVARALGRLGIDFDLIERHSDVGGIWDIESPGSPMYESAHFISSSGVSHFAACPMPSDYPDYPSHARILDYIRRFAASEGLYERLVPSTTVRHAERTGTGWEVELFRAGGRAEARRYSQLVCASGTTWSPRLPTWEGAFAGEQIHSSTYRDAESLQGKRVLVVGAGNSGCDIACDAAVHAREAHISIRRGYHFVPKHVFGMPTDRLAEHSEWLPFPVQRRAFELILHLHNGDLEPLGLAKPDHRLLESHPIMNDQLIHHLRHGDLCVQRDIARIDGHTVHFVDGRSVEVDLIVCATGCDTRTPYLPEGAIAQRGERPDLFLNLFSREDPALFAIGFLESNSGLFKLFDQMAHVLAHAIAAAEQPEVQADLRRIVEGESPDTSGGIRYLASARHANYVNLRAYRRELHRLARRLGWPRFDPARLLRAGEVLSEQAVA